MPLSITIAILCLNEERGLKNTYSRFKKILTDLDANHEFIIVNDGSADKTAQIAEEIKENDPAVTIVTNKKTHGMGYGFKKGLEKASKEFYMFTGGYNALSEGSITQLIEKSSEQDITLAYIANPEARSKSRQKLSGLFTGIMNAITGLNLHYYNALHVLRTDCRSKIKIRSNQQTFSAECVVKLIKFHNCSFREVPVTISCNLKGTKNTKAKLRKLTINAFDAFRFFYFLIYDMTFHSKPSPNTDR